MDEQFLRVRSEFSDPHEFVQNAIVMCADRLLNSYPRQKQFDPKGLVGPFPRLMQKRQENGNVRSAQIRISRSEQEVAQSSRLVGFQVLANEQQLFGI
jgi:hypothetical protein